MKNYCLFQLAVWGVALGAGFCMGSMVPSLVRFVDSTRRFDRQVAGAVLTSAFVGMGTLTGVTGVLMTSRDGFEMVLLVTSVTCTILLCAVCTFATRLATCIEQAIPKSILTDFAMDPNQNMISPENEKKSRKKKRVVDANGNVVESSSRVGMARQYDGSRVRGEAHLMLSIVSLGSRSVVGRW